MFVHSELLGFGVPSKDRVTPFDHVVRRCSQNDNLQTVVDLTAFKLNSMEANDVIILLSDCKQIELQWIHNFRWTADE